ncbi:MAG: bifunctional precorrin-2 dehydrogenase/sirohydrochlorin ferrochelatase [Chloroflexi bacterium]|nr:bifunctional precorrin-2 dehydrogenase/sirohydrochlorin ferrochelatase [Chloroflexota bacterium]
MSRTMADRHFAYYPALLDLFDRRAVVVGGGEVATTKVQGLLPCGLRDLIVVAPEVSALIGMAARAGYLVWRQQEFQPEDLEGAQVAFAATDDRGVNARVAEEARRRGVWVLTVDDVPHCDFIAPALVRRGGLTIAISTGGASPAIAYWVKKQLEVLVPAWWGELLEIAGGVRDQVRHWPHRPDATAWRQALDAGVTDAVATGEREQARRLLVEKLEQARPRSMP